MGYFRHHTIIVTGWDAQSVAIAQQEAKKLFFTTSEVTPTAINGFISFFIPPDGSKEGWDASDDCNQNRDKFIEWLHSHAYSLRWVEVSFGEDGNVAPKILRHD